MANDNPKSNNEDDYDIQALLDAQPVITTVIDPRSYTALFQNETGKQKLGNIRGKLCYKNIPKEEAVCAFCRMPEAIRTGEVQNSEVKLPDGTWLLVQFSPVQRQDGTMDVVETITDITAQKSQEEGHEKTLSLMVDREDKIHTLREQLKELGAEPKA